MFELHSIQLAKKFFADPKISQNLNGGENEVLEIWADGKKSVLRITSKSHRSRDDLQAELSIIAQLVAAGFPAAAPMPSLAGELIVEHDFFYASAFEFAPGERVKPFGPDWNEDFFTEWGRILGRLHSVNPSAGRFAWHKDPIVIQMAETFRFEPEAVATYNRIVPQIPTENLVLVHGDLGLSNFHRTDEGVITVFDFDDCCHHMPMIDIATALWPLRHRKKTERDQYLGWMLTGYREFSSNSTDLLQHMFEWRTLYMFANHLRKWKEPLSEGQISWLDGMREQLANPTQWM